jgi:hypothetical protein
VDREAFFENRLDRGHRKQPSKAGGRAGESEETQSLARNSGNGSRILVFTWRLANATISSLSESGKT